MQTDLQRELERLGFSERQACMYLALLRFGKTGVLQLSLATGVPRASCYNTLEQLCKQGLVRAESDADQQVFVAEPPERILTLLQLQVEEIEIRRKRTESVLPQLAALTGDGSIKPKVRVVSDFEEVLEIHRDYAAMSSQILQLVGYDAFLKLQKSTIVHEQQHRLSTHRSPGRAILVTDTPAHPPEGSRFEVRCIPAAMIEVPGEMTICGDHVLLFAYSHAMLAVEIVSPAIAATCRATLELAWQRAGEIERQIAV